MELDRWLGANGGVVRRAGLVAHGVAESEIKRRLRRREWQAPFRGVVVTDRATEPAHVVRCRAALCAAGPGAYLTCIGAALLRELPVPPDAPVHVAVPKRRAVRPRPGLVAHRDAGAAPPSAYAGLPAVNVEVALVGAFGCLPR